MRQRYYIAEYRIGIAFRHFCTNMPCHTDLAQDETCTPEEEGEGEEEEEEVRGPAKRRKVGKIKKAVTPCMTGQVCREVGLNENMCKMEETDCKKTLKLNDFSRSIIIPCGDQTL